jgi:hypothetical protein
MEFWIGNDPWNVNKCFIDVVKLFHQTVGKGLFAMIGKAKNQRPVTLPG